MKSRARRTIVNRKVVTLIEKYKEQIIVLIIMLILAFFQVFRCIEYPGLYYDAVNPDYMAVQLLYPQVENPLWIVPHTGLPLLGQLYHGTFTAWVQALVIGLTGNASLWTIRTVNMAYIVGICWFCYRVGKWANIQKGILYSGIAVIILSPQVYAMIRTQYYIKLPGTFFLLAAIYTLMKMRKNDLNKGKLLILSGVFCGLAAYTYFIFLFYIPAIIVFCAIESISRKEKTKNVVIYLVGVLGGGTLYIVGFFDLFLTYTTLNDEIKKCIIYAFTVGVIAIVGGCCFVCIKNYHKDKVIRRVCIFVALIAGIGIFIVGVNLSYILKVILPQVQTLHVLGETIPFHARIQQFFVLWEGVMSNRFLEQMILGKNTSILPQTYNIVFLLLILLFLIVIRKEKGNHSILIGIKFCFLLLSSYYVFSLPFISRMGGQHFTPNYFIMMLIIILELGYLYSQKGNWAQRLAGPCIAVILVVSMINSNLLDTNIKIVGGVDKYSSEINQLSKEALEENKMGEKVVYVFPEWGLYCGFNYLTMNQIPVLLEVDKQSLKNYLIEGYTIKLCTWEEQKILEYQKVLKDIGIDNARIRNRKVFFEVTWSQSHSL